MALAPLQQLHDGVSQGRCICHLDLNTILAWLDLSPKDTGQESDNTEVEASSTCRSSCDERGLVNVREEDLVRLSLMTSIVEVNHGCIRVKEAQGVLVQNCRVQTVLSKVCSADRLVVYSACKCTEVMLSFLAPKDEKLTEEFLTKIFQSILHPKAELDDESTSTANKVIFTFDLFADLLRMPKELMRSETKCQAENTLPCLASSMSAVDNGANESCSLGQKTANRNIAEMCHTVIQGDLLEICAVFAAYFKAETLPDSNDDAHQNTFLSWLYSLNSRDSQNVCYAYLKCLQSHMKIHVYHQQQHSKQVILSFLHSILTNLVPMLKSACHGNVANFMMLLIVLTTCVEACMKAATNTQHCEGAERSIGHLQSEVGALLDNVVEDIVGGCLFEKIQYHEGLLGFGGTDISEGDGKSLLSSVEYTRGDKPLLRKMVRLLIHCLEYSTHLNRSGMTRCDSQFQQLSNFIARRLKDDDKPQDGDQNRSQVDWIFDLFGDQDDALVRTLLSLLKIGVTSCSTLRNSRSCTSPSNEGGGEEGSFACLGEFSCDSPCKTASRRDEQILASHERMGSDSPHTTAPGKQDKTILDPHLTFSHFLHHMTLDHSILLDLLISMETEFLEYFIRYLRFATSDWHSFVTAHESFGLRSNAGACREESSDDHENDDESDGFVDVYKGAADDSSEDDDDGGDDHDDIEDEDDAENEIYAGKRDVSVVAVVNSKHDCHSEKKIAKKQKDMASLALSVSNERKRKRSFESETDVDEVGQKLNRTDTEQTEKLNSEFQEPMIQESSDLGQNSSTMCASPIVHSVAGSLDDVMSVLIRLRLAIERLCDKNLFPFSAKPLLRLLIRAESLYEDDDK